MIARPLFSMLVCFSSTLMLAGTAQAQGLFGFPFFAPYNAQPRYVSPCGPNGCPTNVNTRYAPRTNCPGGVCSVPNYGYSSNYAPRGYGVTNGVCGQNGCPTCNCGRSNCPQCCPSGLCAPNYGNARTLPYDYGYPSRTLPMPATPPRDDQSYRPRYYDEELPARMTPPAYRAPRSDYYYGAGRSDRYDTATADRSRSKFEADRSPFYP